MQYKYLTKLILIIGLISFSIPTLGSTDITCAKALADNIQQTGNLEQKALELIHLQNHSNKSVGKSVQSFVDDSVYWGLLSAQVKLSPEQITQALNDHNILLRKVSSYNPSAWAASWFPSEKLREEAFKSILGQFGKDPSEAQKILESPIIPISEEVREDIEKFANYEYVPDTHGQKEERDLNTSLNRIAAVLPTALFSTPKAQRALIRIQEIMRLKGSELLPKETSEVLTDSRYQDGIRRAALKVLNKVTSQGIPEGHLFDDILSSFIESGLDSKTAEDFTWQVLAVISKGGPNTYWRMLSYGSRASNGAGKLGLSIIAGGLGLLDYRTRDSGHMYSLPRSVTGHAEVGKPYHFWMSAYLARRIATEFHSTRAGASAAFTAAMAYQFISRSEHRSPERALVVASHDGINNIIRMDMVNAAAGARFGSLSAVGKTEELNIDRGFQFGLQRASNNTGITDDQSSTLFRDNTTKAFWLWTKRFRPFSVFTYFNGVI